MDDHERELTPEQEEQLRVAVGRARSLVQGLTVAAALAWVGRRIFGRVFRFPRLSKRKIAAFAFGCLVALVSLTSCSVVGLDDLIEAYGPPVPATRSAAEALVERSATAVRAAPSLGAVSLSLTDAEATSALSLGMMMPELVSAMQSVSAEEVQATESLDDLRTLLRSRRDSVVVELPWKERVLRALDPELRTDDVQVRFTDAAEVVIAAEVKAWRWRQPALVVVAPRAGAGELELDFVEGRLGWLPAPEFAFDLLGRLLSSLILMGGDYAEISRLAVTEGVLTFEARVR